MLRIYRAVRLSVIALTVLLPCVSEGKALPVIPGAAGFGMETVAGSGRHLDPPQTRVYKVTNLNDSGSGSLRAALEAEGPRTVVFEVSGYIELDRPISINRPYLTVAGQTAPWPGIVVRGGFTTNIGTHDVLIQDLGFRPGGQFKGEHKPHRSAMRAGGSCRNIVIDHCSFGWTTQQGLNVSGSHITVRLNIFSEGLYNAGHNEPEHSKGMAIASGQREARKSNIAVVGNLFAHNHERNPAVPPGASVVILNNFIYNYGAHGVKAMKDNTSPMTMSVIGNVFLPGVNTGGDPDRPWRGKPMWVYLMNPASRVYLSSDNLMGGRMYDDPWERIEARYHMGQPNSRPEPRAVVHEPPLVIPGYEVKPSRETEAWVLANVGPRPANRGPIDARIVYETRTRTGRGRDDVEDAGGWPELPENRRRVAIPEDPVGDDDGDGYTNLEEWLHACADEVEHAADALATKEDRSLGRREAARVGKYTSERMRPFSGSQRPVGADWALSAAEAQRRQAKVAEETGLPAKRRIDLGEEVTLELALIPPGEFVMGSKYPPREIDRRGPGGNRGLYPREYPGRRVRLTKPYYMGIYEVTQRQWDYALGTVASRRKGASETAARGDKSIPVASRSWNECQKFIEALNEKVGRREGLRFRLPTEAEWEYACRAGSDTPFHTGERITTDLANYEGKRPWDREVGENRDGPVAVGSFPPNAWGLYDMIGNVSELTQDGYGPYPPGQEEPLVDPRSSTTWIYAFRGGSWTDAAAECRSAFANYVVATRRWKGNGLRLVAVGGETP